MTPQHASEPLSAGKGPGESTVNPTGIILMSAYVIIMVLFSAYLLIKVWPHCLGVTVPPLTHTSQTGNSNRPSTQTNQNANSNSSISQANQNGNRSVQTPGPGTTESEPRPPATNLAAGSEPQCENPTWTEFFWPGGGYWIWEEVRLLLIVIIAGMLGALLHVMRSLFWYVGHRDLRLSWVLMYVLLPLVGPLMALGFYFVIRGGFFPQAKADESNPIGFAALAFLMGLFTAQAGVKLKQVFETIFSPAPQGANSRPQLPTTPPPSAPPAAIKVSAISPTEGPTAGGQAVAITGENFSEGLSVRFGETAASSVKLVGGTINAVTPAHPAGPVDVIVTNKDGRSATLTNGYTYEGP